ncbi:hypothetical protein [Insulibacter thermoxylanivorax]|nr:hypothetical protein [Insulibacter thermoxylanivorax]
MKAGRAGKKRGKSEAGRSRGKLEETGRSREKRIREALQQS